MMNTVRKTVQWSLLLGLSQTAAAATYDFSYTFTANNTQVVGSFDGTTVGDFVVGISNIQVSYEGHALTGPLFAYRYDAAAWESGTPVVSFTQSSNQFIFVDCAHLACAGDNPGSAYNFFVLRNGGSPRAAVYFGGGFANLDSNTASVWTLTDRAAAVPEPAPWALLAGGLLAVGWLRRQR